MMPTPVTIAEWITANWLAMKAPEDRPDTVVWLMSALSAGRARAPISRVHTNSEDSSAAKRKTSLIGDSFWRVGARRAQRRKLA